MGLTSTGYLRRTYDEILNDKITKCEELFGADINTDENTPLGKFIRINAYDQSLIEEEAEAIYYSIFPNTASGTSLDRLCVFVGITRNPATFAQYKVKITGVADTVVPVGFLVKTSDDVEFATIEEVVVASDGNVEVTVECMESGEIGNVNFSDIASIVNPISDIESVIGTSVVTIAKEVESDYDLRRRFNNAKEGIGSCNETAIRAALLRIPTVNSASVIVNESDETDAEGRPPRSFECYVSGGEDYYQEIATTIFEKKPVGIRTHGSISETITDDGGYSHTIKFSHVDDVDVCVNVAILTDSKFEGHAGHAEIKSNLENYINSLGISKKLILSSLYGYIYSVTGVKEVTDLELSTDGTNWSTENIFVEDYQCCRCVKVIIKSVGWSNDTGI